MKVGQAASSMSWEIADGMRKPSNGHLVQTTAMNGKGPQLGLS